MIQIPKDMKAELTAIAEEQNRSLSNLIVTILGDWLKSR